MHLPAYWANKCPDIVLLKGWPQSKADCGKFPTARKRGAITVIPIEYKTCDDFRISETIQQNVYDKYSPNDESPHPHPPNLLTELRAQGWRTLGYNPRDKTVGASASHNSMLAIAIGHGAFLPNLCVRTVFREALGLSLSASDALALALVRHQTVSNARIMSTANYDRRALPGPPPPRPVHRRASGIG
jgi:hypothetical protein